jgi:outer membrane protein assembly factor BamB
MKTTKWVVLLFIAIDPSALHALPPALNRAHYMLVSDWSNNQVLRFDAHTGSFIDAFATSGPGFAALSQPAGMALTPEGDLLVASSANGRILKFDGRTGDFERVLTGGIDIPVNMQYGSDGFLYVTSRGQNRVIKVNPTTGTRQFFTISPEAWDIEFGRDGNMYVSSFEGFRIFRYDPVTGQRIDTFAVGQSNERFAGFLFADNGVLYQSTFRNTVRQFDSSTGANLGIFATSSATLSTNLAFGPDGNMYVTFERTPQVERFDKDTGLSLGVFATLPSTQGAISILFTSPIPEPSSSILFFVGWIFLIQRRFRTEKGVSNRLS